MDMELSLKEKFVILAYDPDKGTCLASNFFGYGIAGAILLELAEMKRISIEGKKIKLLDSHKAGDPMLDRVISILLGSKRDMRVKALISKIAQSPRKYKKPLIKGLIEKRYLKEVRKKFLIFPYKRYPSTNTSFRREMVEKIRRLVLRKDGDDRDILLLTGLAGACKFSHKFFDTKEERKIAKKRIKEIIEESQIDKAIDETIKAVQAAVLISVTTSAAVAGASH